MTAPEQAGECRHRWMRVAGLRGEGWSDAEALFEVCLNDCGAIREQITGRDVVRWPEARLQALETELVAVKELYARATDEADSHFRAWQVSEVLYAELRAAVREVIDRLMLQPTRLGEAESSG